MVRWVEEGVAPETITGAHWKDNDVANGLDFTRPLCRVRPFPRFPSFPASPDFYRCSGPGCVANEAGGSVPFERPVPGRRPKQRRELRLRSLSGHAYDGGQEQRHCVQLRNLCCVSWSYMRCGRACVLVMYHVEFQQRFMRRYDTVLLQRTWTCTLYRILDNESTNVHLLLHHTALSLGLIGCDPSTVVDPDPSWTTVPLSLVDAARFSEKPDTLPSCRVR